MNILLEKFASPSLCYFLSKCWFCLRTSFLFLLVSVIDIVGICCPYHLKTDQIYKSIIYKGIMLSSSIISKCRRFKFEMIGWLLLLLYDSCKPQFLVFSQGDLHQHTAGEEDREHIYCPLGQHEELSLLTNRHPNQ